jgi:phospholipid/cholesterol/gamma-HCH transport system substrate-binding protein
MKHSKTEFLAGLFVLLGLAAIAYLTVKLGSGATVQGGSYSVEARFANAGGIHPGCSVLLSGVTVGRVESVRMETSDYSAIVVIRIISLLKLPTDSMASVKTSGLIGDKYIALSPGAESEYLKPHDRITLTESAVDLESLIGKMAFGSVDKEKNSKENSARTTP